MTAAEIWQGIGMVVAGIALVAVAAIAYLAILRWVVVIVAAILLVGFAFEPDLQLKFTATLLGGLAILYLPPIVVARVWRQCARLRPVASTGINPPSSLETAYQSFADEETQGGSKRQDKVARDARDQDDRDSRVRDLERQGMVSLWSRQ